MIKEILKEKVVDLGLNEQQISKLWEVLSVELEGYIDKSEYESVQTELANAKTELESFKAGNVDVEALNSEVEKLQEELKQKDSYAEQLKIDSAVELSIKNHNGKNSKAIKALLNYDIISINEKGEVVGIEEQLIELANNEDTKFLFDDKEQILIKGATPIASEKTTAISKDDFRKMSYKERLALYNKDSGLYNQLNV